ncbi:membrane-bound ClpP family serine protease [Methanomicrobium sp. W14]|uniref:NfeD family protein n=1 Tax=Methanomicrobium sp. W14 TaxID=2817839 RepID=UPI001AE1AD58|nr:NfeD family protein [Methanomicrobium sp. W14]MBP2132725.1 membrane-bound ClpP family serine protease [Methanomicrobium sp. W14]
MVSEVIAIGWALIVIGVILLLAEAFNPGFFLAVPGTTLIILGAISLLFPEIFSSTWIILIGIITALFSAGASVFIYSRITAESSVPYTTSRDSLVGKTGIATKKIEPDNISGKVEIDNVEWSAKSSENTIGKGKKVRVIASKGVHVIVEEA